MTETFLYPGDDVLCKALGETLREIRIERGFSLKEAAAGARAAMAARDYKRSFRALGLAINEAREQRHVSRRQLSRSAGLALRNLILIERGLAGDLPITDFFRISYALKMRAELLVQRYEEIEQNMVRGVSS